MYREACLYGAMYDVRILHPSIWYPEGSNNLHIALMFDEKREANKFMNCLINYNIGSVSLLKGRLNICRDIEEVNVDTEGSYVHSDDYKFEDSDSPSNTWDDVKSPTEIEVTQDPLLQMRSLENLNLMPPGDTLYKCRIAPEAFFPEYKKDGDNILFGSNLFHKYFDGDGKRKPNGADFDWGTKPKFKLEFDSQGPEQIYLGTRYFLIRVLVTFQDPIMARVMEGRWREGTESIGDLQFRSFFYTSNLENCIKFIAIKKSETELRWGEADEAIEV
jgi:hypothetical protein